MINYVCVFNIINTLFVLQSFNSIFNQGHPQHDDDTRTTRKILRHVNNLSDYIFKASLSFQIKLITYAKKQRLTNDLNTIN